MTTHQVRQDIPSPPVSAPVARRVETVRASSRAVPWKALHPPTAVLTRRPGVHRRISGGAVTVTSRNPMPSTARVAISCHTCPDAAPAREPRARKPMPATTVRRRPSTSENRETARAASMAATCTIPSSTPEATRDMPSSSRTWVSTPGSFHTCMAAAIPGNRTNTQARAD